MQLHRLRRRAFITLLGGAAATWPLAVRAQQAGKIPVIGFLGSTAPEMWTDWTKAFVDRLAELGWIDGRTVNIVYRWGYGRTERFGELAAELVALKVDLILTSGGATLQTMKETSQIPIVSRRRANRSRPIWWRACRGRTAMSLAFRLNRRSSPANAPVCCAL
jgi:putative ABC transport system substrate-binding protein